MNQISVGGAVEASARHCIRPARHCTQWGGVAACSRQDLAQGQCRTKVQTIHICALTHPHSISIEKEACF